MNVMCGVGRNTEHCGRTGRPGEGEYEPKAKFSRSGVAREQIVMLGNPTILVL